MNIYYYLPLIATPILFFLWFTMSRALNHFDPWLNLQSIYGVAATGNGKKLRLKSALINGVRFVACLTYVLTKNGIFIRQSPALPFRSKELALFIPWDEIEITKTDYWTKFPYEIHMRSIPQIDFRVRHQIGDEMILRLYDHTSEKR
jgi:hypothetical protein